jgi:site-specific DNA-methyltransferase (adenine-specific)
MRIVKLAESLSALPGLTPNFFDLVYIDPPFNTGKTQKLGVNSYEDSFEEYKEFLTKRIKVAKNKLTPNGSMFVHVDWRESHYVKVWLDEIFGRDCFMNEIIWAYDYGGRSKKKWSSKHDTIFWYVKDPKNYTFNYDAIDRIPYMAPGLVGPEKAAKGKTPTDVWWNTIVPTNGKERTGYPTQKPVAILERIIKVHTNPGDTVLDFFAGSGTTGQAAINTGRDFYLIDENWQAIGVMKKRFKNEDVIFL